jgi:hypothetical protein
MLAVFIATFAAGAVLLGASIIFGGGDDLDADHDIDLDHDVDLDIDHDVDLDLDAEVDVDVDVDLDADHDVDVGHGTALSGAGDAGQAWLPFLSMRFWTFGATAFGAIGALLMLVGISAAIAAAVATPVGLATGLGAAWVFRYLKHNQVTADTGRRGLIGVEARVLLSVRPGSVGKIAVITPEGRVEMRARTGDGRALPIGASVLVTDIDDDGIADVTAMDQVPKEEGLQREAPASGAGSAAAATEPQQS